MKKLRMLGAGVACVVGLVYVLHAQEAAAQDSVVKIVAEESGLSPVTPQDLPENGTFWNASSNGVMAPWPCLPPNAADFPIYTMADGIFLVDSSGGKVATDDQQTVADALAGLVDSVANLITWIQEAQVARSLARAMGREEELDEEGGGGFTPLMLLDTNSLYLELTSYTPSLARLNLHNATNAGGVYAILSTTDMAIPFAGWTVERELWPVGEQTNVLPFTIATQGRQNLFARAKDITGVDSDGDGILDFWAWEYWGSIHVTDTNLDYSGSGNTFAWDYSNNVTPTVFQFTGIAVTNNYVNNMTVPVHLDVAGNPYYLAISLDDTNYAAAANWQTYASSNLTVNLGLTEGWHDVWIGLRGHGDDVSSAVWQWKRLKLDWTPPALTLTNPTNATVDVPLIQLQGYSPEELDTISCDVSNALGMATNLEVGITHRDYDSTAAEFSTNYFECLDIPLTNGLNIITLHAEDLAGNVSTVSYSLTVDYSAKTNPPNVQITWPQDEAEISGSHFTIRGQVTDPTVTVSATITDTNGNTNVIAGLVERDGRFWLDDLPLDSGSNSVSITVEDIVGNQTTTNFNVIQSALILTMNPVSEDSQLWQPTIGVSGTVSDSGAVVTVNGVAAAVEPNVNGAGTYNWSANAVPNTTGGVAVFQLQAEVSGRSPAQSAVDWDKPSRLYLTNYTARDYGMGHVEFSENDWVWTYDWNGNDYCHWSDGQGGSSSEWAEERYGNIDGQGGWSHESLAEQTTNPPSQWPAIAPGQCHDYIYGEGAWAGQPPYAVTNENTSPDWFPGLAAEHCHVQMSVGETYIGNGFLSDPVVSNNNGTYWRTADATMVLETGGRALSQHKNLFCLSGSAGEVRDKFAHLAGGTGNPIGWIWDQTTVPIPMRDVKIDGQPLGGDGKLWRAYEDNVTRDVTPQVKNKDFYTFDEPTPTKYHLYIGLSTSTTNANLDTDTPEVCVGQSVLLAANWQGGNTPPADASIKWHLPEKYANQLVNYSATCQTYVQNEDLLTNRVQQCWYVNKSGGACSVREILHFANGQYATVVAAGNFTVYRPQKIDKNMNEDLLNPTVNIPSPSLYATNVNGMLELGDTNGGYARFWAEYNSSYPGEFREAQIFQSYRKAGNDDPVDSGSQWWFDGAYDKGGIISIVRSGGGVAFAMQTDISPGMPLKAPQTVVNDVFKTYFQFKPAGDGIWVTMGRVNWSWAATSTYTNGQWNPPSGTTVSDPQYHDDDSFPLWDGEHP